MHKFLSLVIFAAFSMVLTAEARLNPGGTSQTELRETLQQGARQNHHALGYAQARIELLGRLTLERKNTGYVIRDVYCEDEYSAPGPGRIPNANVLNTEHTWPQSRFGGSSRDMQKSDLHHLFPSDSQVNGVRGNHPFGEVAQATRLKCSASRAGNNNSGTFVFEPPPAHRGNVARALFYFSVRYDLNIDSTQEKVLRKWSDEDPVDNKEIERNDEIEKLQGNRNPFIDQPELATFLSDF